MLVDRAAAHVEQPTIERVRSISWIAPAIAASRRGTGGARHGRSRNASREPTRGCGGKAPICRHSPPPADFRSRTFAVACDPRSIRVCCHDHRRRYMTDVIPLPHRPPNCGELAAVAAGSSAMPAEPPPPAASTTPPWPRWSTGSANQAHARVDQRAARRLVPHPLCHRSAKPGRMFPDPISCTSRAGQQSRCGLQRVCWGVVHRNPDIRAGDLEHRQRGRVAALVS
jgi:hypothetical protein